MSTSNPDKVRSKSVPSFLPQTEISKKRKRKSAIIEEQNSRPKLSEIVSNVSVDVGSCSDPHSGRPVIDLKLPCPAQKVQDVIFNKSQWLSDIYEKRGYSNINLGDWETNDEGEKKRVNKYTMPVNNPVAKEAHVTEILCESNSHNPPSVLAYSYETINSGVPYQDSFSVLLHQCVTQTGKNQCLFHIDAQINYKKTVLGFIKSIIEKGTYSGMDDFYKDIKPRLEQLAGVSQEVVTKPPKKPPRLRKTKKVSEESSSQSSVLVWGLLLILLAVNFTLYWQVTRIENENEDSLVSIPSDTDHFLTLSKIPESKEEWQKIVLKLQETHSTEIMRWRELMASIIKQLRQTENDIYSLQQNIATYETHKLLQDLQDDT